MQYSDGIRGNQKIDIIMYEKIQESFEKQGLMKTLGAQLLTVEKGLVKIVCPFSEELSQQHGFFHVGVTTQYC